MMNELQTYMVHEYVADYKAGHLSRRDLLRRVLNITGGLSSTATLLLVLRCLAAAPGPAAAAAGEPGRAAITDPTQFSALLTGPNVNPDQFVGDFASAVALYKTRPNLVQADKIGMNGYCFGGGVVWRCTEQIPELKAAAPFYGAFPPSEKWDQIKAAVLGGYSSDPNDFANAPPGATDKAL